MRSTLLAVLLWAPSALLAQPVLLSEALPPIGSVITQNRVISPELIDTTLQGTGITWDFSDLITDGAYMTHQYIDPTSTSQGASFPEANYAQVEQNWVGQTFLIFFEKTGTYLDVLGYWSGDLGPIIYDLPIRDLIFPITLGTIYEGANDSITYSLAGLGTGTLILPSATYTDVLMIRRIHHFSDTFRYHEWYSTENGVRLLQLITTTNEWYPIDGWTAGNISLPVREAELPDRFHCISPVLNELEIIHSNKIEGIVDLSITTTAGQIIRSETLRITTADQRSSLFVGDLAAGIYLLTLKPQDEMHAAITIRFVKQ